MQNEQADAVHGLPEPGGKHVVVGRPLGGFDLEFVSGDRVDGLADDPGAAPICLLARAPARPAGEALQFVGDVGRRGLALGTRKG